MQPLNPWFDIVFSEWVAGDIPRNVVESLWTCTATKSYKDIPKLYCIAGANKKGNHNNNSCAMRKSACYTCVCKTHISFLPEEKKEERHQQAASEAGRHYKRLKIARAE